MLERIFGKGEEGGQVEEAPQVENGDVTEAEDVDVDAIVDKLDVVEAEELEQQQLQQQVSEATEQQQPLPTEQQTEQVAQDVPDSQQGQEGVQQQAPYQQEQVVPDADMETGYDQMPDVQPVPLETIKEGLQAALGEDLKALDAIAETGEGSLSSAMGNVLAKFTQMLGVEIASTLQPVIAPLQQQLQIQQVQGLWQQFTAQHPEVLEDKQLFDTMRDVLNRGEATTYEAAYDIARVRTGKLGNSGTGRVGVDRAKLEAANLVSSTANRRASVANRPVETFEDAFANAARQHGLL